MESRTVRFGVMIIRVSVRLLGGGESAGAENLQREPDEPDFGFPRGFGTSETTFK